MDFIGLEMLDLLPYELWCKVGFYKAREELEEKLEFFVSTWLGEDENSRVDWFKTSKLLLHIRPFPTPWDSLVSEETARDHLFIRSIDFLNEPVGDEEGSPWSLKNQVII